MSVAFRVRTAALCLGVFLSNSIATANPLDALRRAASGEPETLARLPDDNVEGMVWEYKGVLERGEVDDSVAVDPEPVDGKPAISGNFRTEGEAIFLVESTLRLPGRKEVKEVVESLRDGKPQNIPLPGAEPKRIGEYKLARGGKLSMNFDDSKGLYGTLILRQKKGTDGVWIGDYREKDGKRTIRTWQMTVRGVKD